MKKLFLALLLLSLSGLQLSAQGVKVGDVAPDFKLKNVDGNYVSFSDFPEAKGFVVIFTCNHCPFSIAYEDRIIALDNKYKSKGYPVIAINPNDPAIVPADGFKEMKARADEKSFTFPYLFDEGQKIFPLYGATRTPHVFLVTKKGKENIVAYIGAIDDNSQDEGAVKNAYLENAIKALLENRTPSPEFTKAIGCTIKTGTK
ncbi:MAG: thioredoxin family protein [Bacteroidales bacterium]|nr:thioredoxin family protein [Bacteroidales bacterium]